MRTTLKLKMGAGLVAATVLMTGAGAAFAAPAVSTDAPAPAATTSALNVEREGGADRFSTSAIVSSSFPAGAPVAYIASGSSYPDALAGAAAAGYQDGPVLLTRQDEIPEVVANELARLNPEKIVVLGGTDVISTAVQATLAETAETTRIGGATRYETAALVSAELEPGVEVAYIASGANFPDALAGAAVAGVTGGPILLVEQNAIPAAVTTELARLKPESIVVLGGIDVVTSGVEEALDATFAPTTRLGMDDRYDTAALISRESFEVDRPVVYIASGLDFPDALAGAAAAGSNDSPVLLIQPNSIPYAVAAELERLNPERIVVLGGTAVLSSDVQYKLDEYLR